MTVNRRPAAELAYRLADQERRIKALARKPQLANSSLENGALEEYDADGNLSTIIGAQHDGTHGAVTVSGPTPPVPVEPTVEVVPGVITVRWSGKFEEDETSPLDFKHVSVHVLPLGEHASPENQRATIRGELGDVATITAEPGVYFVSLISWSTAGKFSAPSESVEIYVPDLADTDALSQELADAREEIETTRVELNGRLITAEHDLAEHETRLASAEDELTTLENETLPTLEADLANAKETLDGLPAQLAESGQKIDAATDRLDTLENETLPGLSGQISSAQSRLTAAESTLAPLPGKISEAEADLVSAFGELSTVDSRISTAKSEAISTAATDATAKANAAKSAAEAKAQTAQDAADAALTMAGSKSKVYYSQNGPSGTASPGDTWRKVDAQNNVIAEWRVTASGAWVSQEITTSMIANLDVGKLTAGSAVVNSAVINKLAVGIATVIQLNADTITSGKLTSAQINTSDLAASIATIIQLNASRITAGTISADRLNIADLSARIATVIQLDASRITAGKINTARLNASEIAAAVATVIQLNASRITSGTISTARLNASEIAAATAAFQTVDVKNLFVSTGTMSEAVINKLWVDVVRSRKITTDMLLVGSGGNLIPDPNFEGTGWSLTSSRRIVNDGYSGGKALEINNAGVQDGSYLGLTDPVHRFIVPAGSVLRVSGWVNSTQTIAPNSAAIFVRLYARGTTANYVWATPSNIQNTETLAANKWHLVEGQVTAPADLDYEGVIGYYKQKIHNGVMRWSGVRAEMAVTTSIIAAGAIMAPHLNVVSENPNGGRLEIMPNGLSVYGPEGGEPVTSITSDGGAVYSVTDPSTGDVLAAIDPDGGMTAQELSVSGESRLDGVVVINGDPLQDSHLGTDSPGEWGPVINGRSLLGTTFTNYVEEHPAVSDVHSWLTPLPHGVIANAWNNSSAGTNADGKWTWNGAGGQDDNRMMLVSTQEFISGRMYSITYKTCAIRATDSGSGTLGAAILRVSSPGGSVSAGSGSTLVGSRIYIPGDGTYFTPSYQGYFRCPEDIPAGRVMLGAEIYVYQSRKAESTGTADARRWEIAVADMGLRRPENNGDMVNLRKQGTATPPPPTPTAPTPKQYTYTANATWWQAYKGDKSKATHSSYSGTAAQGRTPYATSNGTMRGLIGFPSLASKLSGATVKKIEVYVYAKHWHSSTGGTACLGVHGHGSTPTTWSSTTDDVKRQKMKKPEGRWITLPSSVHAGFKSGNLRGISFYPPSGSTSTAYYGTFTGNKSRIRVTYVK